MLDFEHATRFSIIVESKSIITDPVYITGVTKDGTFTLRHVPTNDKVLKTEEFIITDIPVWISARSSCSGSDANSTYVTVSLAINGNPVYKLLAGYIYSQTTITWPISDLNKSLPDTIGRITAVTGANPAAGVNIFDAVPSGEVWKIRAVTFQFVTAAVAGNRVVHLRFGNSDGGNFDTISSVTQITTETKIYSAIPLMGNGALSNDDDIILPIPADIYLDANGYIETTVTGLNAGDNFGAPTYWIERFYV